ncbi:MULTISPECIES: isoleucine--tRNA ligase [Aerococcus]|uniref:Isoleucine--tRNA ligase n=1 Tax=Aerococcus sanguinicola TaxID=119206 RepID=A0A5N1GKY7_9LACT|nr:MULTISPECIES: isoleucine--tRNA ligase [Aerococcus]KAA9300879.1 isoleucine--tRNA ligase [Aerococcus sanguinicola]MDK6369111.1 isoleucine--tRNA ligase [Aerococcus sp. UMB9870]MDK6679830.1 isoleucine--tRNA ligase [Aerococcus sp. UMB8608]MDK6686604.1 isoleucine--tRNA ligase [Aerococcus sp. UMB8623]MDK6939752.1 isoleucine--tRNA ligase [Aerococcus sp. UMB8487]
MKMKETLNLGKTKFPMRGNLPVKEVERQKEWEEQDIYGKRQALNKDKTPFVLHDGPPYANGAIHIGHAMNKIAKDIIVRSKSMSGYRAPYVPGWDTHGLPIEQAVTNSGVDRKALSTAEFRKICEDYAWKQIEGQKEDFKRLGVAGEWDHPYVTLDPKFEEEQIRVFGKMAAKGLIYKGKRPVYWSPSSESTLAEAEVEYRDVESPSIYVAFKLKDGQGKLPEDSELVIWTTTPWTLPANLGISVHPDFIYSVVEVDGHHFVIAKELLEDVAETLGWEDYREVDEIKGADMDRMVAQHPFYDRDSLVMVGTHVTADSGTGLVHTAPGHGEDDFYIGQAYGLDALSPIDDQGRYTDEAPGLEGIFYEDGNEKVLDKLKEVGALLHVSYFTHSYPHDWRTKKPVIYRATPQWFCSVDKIRDRSLEAIENEVDWLHPSGEKRIYNMIRDRGDWVISRQRVWGVPLPIFYAEDGQEIITEETINHVAELVGEHGSNVWFEREAKDLLPEGFSHPGSPNGQFTKEMDIMDVWFDSGSTHAGVLGTRDNLTFPADLYLEGSDQYRGWFNSSLLTSVAVNDQAPYRAVLSQGFVNDGEGRKMSKSLGNTVSPNDVCKQRGADILRLWVTSADTLYDVRISDDILGQVSEAYRKIRNTIRFMLGNLTDFKPSENGVSYDNLDPIDQFMLNKLNELVKAVEEAYERYDFMAIYQGILNFLTTEMSSFYLDYSKDVTYIELADSPARRKMQTVMYQVVRDLTLLLTPVIPHTTEEIWLYLEEEADYAQLAEFPEVKDYSNSQELLDFWNAFLAFRDDVNKSLEEARNAKLIGKSLEADLIIYADADTQAKLAQVGDQLRTYLIVSQVEIKPLEEKSDQAHDYGHYALEVGQADGEVCQRCRGVYPSVGQIPEAPTLCQRCYDIVSEHFPQALVQEEE